MGKQDVGQPKTIMMNSSPFSDNDTIEYSSISQQPSAAADGQISGWRKFSRFVGPGYMIAVGYLDPGNWATDIQAGSRFGYSLLFIILLSNAMAMVLQHLCVRLGIMHRQDLAQASKKRMPPWANLPMYILAEIAIISCDLAEVIGTALALKLLFGLPIIAGVILTIFDVLLLLSGIGDQKGRGYRLLEISVMILMSIIGLCFIIELFLVKPDWRQVLIGLMPFEATKLLLNDPSALFAALGIIGATVMPHNLYLHSSIVQSRIAVEFPPILEEPLSLENVADSRWSTVIFATLDSILALCFAFFINAAILITAAAAFHARGLRDVSGIEDASLLIRKWLGPLASFVFGCALLAAGQSSTLTGTMAGQIVFEGHLQLKIPSWARRLTTRAIAIVPALVILLWSGTDSINQLLIGSQVILSLQLPFAIIPLIIFAFDETAAVQMPAPNYKTLLELLLRAAAWIIAIILITLNLLFILGSIYN